MIAYSKQSIQQDDIEAIVEALKGEYLTQGPKTLEFEEALSSYLDRKFVITFNSATSALHAAYIAGGLKSNDEIVTSAITFAATANAALFCNAIPKFCDVSYDGNIDAKQIEKHITDKTKLIVPIDFAGNSANIKEIVEIAKKHNLLVIEDASHALGATYHDKKVGFFADMAIYSFHAIKPITTFEGGAVACDDENLYEKLKLIRSHGITKKSLWNSDMTMLGYNYRLSDIASALGLSQLKKLDKFITKREEIASFYDKAFEKNPYFYTIKIENFKKSSRHLYPILLDKKFWCQKEDIFITLRDKGIGVQVHYKPIYQYSYYKQLFGEYFLQNSEDFYKAELSIPCHQEMSLNDAKYVAETLLKIFDNSINCSI